MMTMQMNVICEKKKVQDAAQCTGTSPMSFHVTHTNDHKQKSNDSQSNTQTLCSYFWYDHTLRRTNPSCQCIIHSR